MSWKWKEMKYTLYTRDAHDPMAVQTLNYKLREQALAKGIDYADFVQYGLTLESSSTQANTT